MAACGEGGVEELPSLSTTGRVLVRVCEVSKQYGSGSRAVDALAKISFDLVEGEFLSIVGPSGCGKSTLLMITSGLLPASSGTVAINGTAIDRPFTNLGIVFQSPVLLGWRTALSNILLQVEVRRLQRLSFEDRARELLASVGLKGFEDRYPHELSGGMRQRVAICRALVHDPPLLLMDEPFGALDALTREQLNLDLQRIWQEHRKTVLFVTHNIFEAVFLSDRVLVMSARPGRIRAVLDIDIPRPRQLDMPEHSGMFDYVQEIRKIFHAEGVLSG